LKYLTPAAYSQLRDHVRDSVLPFHVSMGGDVDELRDPDARLEPDQPLPVFTGLNLEITETPNSFAGLKPLQHMKAFTHAP
jgi:hypothetical protein